MAYNWEELATKSYVDSLSFGDLALPDYIKNCDILEPGIYPINGNVEDSKAPTSKFWGTLIVLKDKISGVTQFAVEWLHSGAIYYRRAYNGTFNAWSKMMLKGDISGKLDKVTTKDTYQLYGKNANGEQQMLDYSLGTVGWSIVQRDANGCINVAYPTDTYHATNKQYVDERSGVTGVKGNSETSYRTGNVNITKSNIGLSKVRNVSAYSKTETDNLLAQKIDKSNFDTPVIVSNGTTSIQLPSKGIYMFLYYSVHSGNTHIVFVTYNGLVQNVQYVSSGYSLVCSTSGVVTDSSSSKMNARVFKISDYGWSV